MLLATASTGDFFATAGQAAVIFAPISLVVIVLVLKGYTIRITLRPPQQPPPPEKRSRYE